MISVLIIKSSAHLPSIVQKYTHQLTGHFPGKPALAGCHRCLSSPFLLNLCTFSGKTKTSDILITHHLITSSLDAHFYYFCHSCSTLGRLVAGWVTIFGRANHPGMQPATKANSPSCPIYLQDEIEKTCNILL